jgi:hypothetical protein
VSQSVQSRNNPRYRNLGRNLKRKRKRKKKNRSINKRKMCNLHQSQQNPQENQGVLKKLKKLNRKKRIPEFKGKR